MESNEFRYVKEAMQGLAGLDISGSLLDVLAGILSRQVTVDETTGDIESSGAFDTLLSVFTYIVTPARSDDRPVSPLGFGRERVKEAKEQAENKVRNEVPTEAPTEEPTPEPTSEPTPEPTELPTDEFNLQPLDTGVDAPTLSGEAGEQDIFVVPITEDPNGAFADIGEAVIQNYQQEDGDVVLFVGQESEWSIVDDMVVPVQPQDGNAKLIFNNDPDQSAADQNQSLQIEGAEVSTPFAATPSDITNVDLAFATQTSIEAAGGLESYITAADFLL